MKHAMQITIEQLLKHPGAQAAYGKLIESGTSRTALEHWLLAITSVRTRHNPNKAEVKWHREMAALGRLAMKLAQRTHDAIHLAGCPVTATAEQICEIDTFLPDLRKHGETLGEIASWRRRSRGPSERNQNVLYLLLAICSGTGTYHYREAAQLIDAADAALGRRATCSEHQLSTMMARYNKRISRIGQITSAKQK